MCLSPLSTPPLPWRKPMQTLGWLVVTWIRTKNFLVAAAFLQVRQAVMPVAVWLTGCTDECNLLNVK